MKRSYYQQFLTPDDRVDISFIQDRGKILKFCVNYSAIINGRWKRITRVDSCHGYPHRHVYYLHRKQYRVVLEGDNNTIFTASKEHIIKDFLKIRDNYLQVRPRT